jgi:hypothetical protein
LRLSYPAAAIRKSFFAPALEMLKNDRKTAHLFVCLFVSLDHNESLFLALERKIRV